MDLRVLESRKRERGERVIQKENIEKEMKRYRERQKVRKEERKKLDRMKEKVRMRNIDRQNESKNEKEIKGGKETCRKLVGRQRERKKGSECVAGRKREMNNKHSFSSEFVRQFFLLMFVTIRFNVRGNEKR